MLNHDLRIDDEILVPHPEAPLEAADFITLAGHVDAYLERHGTLRGVLIRAKSFPGREDFGALLAHLNFVKEPHQRIGKVAVLANGAFANIMPAIADRFVHAQVRHFDPAREDAAWERPRQSGKTQLRPAA